MPAFSAARNRSWREPGWVVFDLAAADLDELGRRFSQLGALWWEADQPVRLRMLARRPAGFQRVAAVDWIE